MIVDLVFFCEVDAAVLPRQQAKYRKPTVFDRILGSRPPRGLLPRPSHVRGGYKLGYRSGYKSLSRVISGGIGGLSRYKSTFIPT